MTDLKRNEMIETIRRKLSSPANINTQTFNDVVNQAVAMYSNIRPREVDEDITGDGTWLYIMTSWVKDFSALISVQYPYDSTEQSPTYIKLGRDYSIYLDSGTEKLRFHGSTPTSSEEIRVLYTAPHSVTTATSTIPQIDEISVTDLGAGLLAEVLATEFNADTKSSLPEQTFDLRTKADEYQKTADRFYKLWRSGMGIKEDGSVPAAVVYSDLDWYLKGGVEPLTHPLALQ